MDRANQKAILAEEMSVLLKMIASRSAAALSFRDQARAMDDLTSLLLRESVELTCIYDSNSQIFADVVRPSRLSLRCPNEPRSSGAYFIGQYLDAYQTIMLNDVDIGTVMVRTSLIELNRRLYRPMLLNGLILGLSLLIAFLLTRPLRRAIYQPIIGLAEVVGRMNQHSKLPIQAAVSNEDEIGESIGAFNALINKIQEDKDELTRLAYYDPLTKLANRRMFSERLVFALENARRSGEKMGLILLDLDNFRQANNELGYDNADLMLRVVASRLASALPSNATAFRFGGDEFAILQVGISEPDIEVTAQRILIAFSEPFVVEGKKVSITSSIGIAISGGEDNPNAVMKSADIALYQAKEAGRSVYKINRGA